MGRAKAQQRHVKKKQRRQKRQEAHRNSSPRSPVERSSISLLTRLPSPISPVAYDRLAPRFRLIPIDWQEPPTVEHLVSALQLGDEDGTPVNGVIWTAEEFLSLPWVQEMGVHREGEPDERDLIIERYGDRIPADLAVLDMESRFFGGIAVSNADLIIEKEHILGFAGVGDLRQALILMHRDGWIVPLANGMIVAPGLFLERIDPRTGLHHEQE
ncbi:hypothetical protein [Planobispora rosea]|uniref:hypothetical protein n=1 Tax=Planobispora rosea TaxID=35762 RepID=UPI00114CA016|nr:hypothetical protein [Planobispora rosea]